VTAAVPDNKARAQAFWSELFNAHDLRKIRGFLAPGFVNHNARPGTLGGPEGARQVFSRLWAGCSDMRFDLQATVAEGSKVVCIGVMTGTHDGPFHGISAMHRPTAARQIHVLTFNDTGLITEHLAVRDDVAVLRQLGALPTTSPGNITTPPSETG
jgi:predicted ester cyclase